MIDEDLSGPQFVLTKKKLVRRSMMEGHHTTHTKLVEDETSANTGTRGHYTEQAI